MLESAKSFYATFLEQARTAHLMVLIAARGSSASLSFAPWAASDTCPARRSSIASARIAVSRPARLPFLPCHSTKQEMDLMNMCMLTAGEILWNGLQCHVTYAAQQLAKDSTSCTRKHSLVADHPYIKLWALEPSRTWSGTHHRRVGGGAGLAGAQRPQHQGFEGVQHRPRVALHYCSDRSIVGVQQGLQRVKHRVPGRWRAARGGESLYRRRQQPAAE